MVNNNSTETETEKMATATMSPVDANNTSLYTLNHEEENTKKNVDNVPNGTAPTVLKDLSKEESDLKSSPPKPNKPLNQTPNSNQVDASYERIKGTFSSVNSKVAYLVHWENTVHSGAALTSILAFLVLTAYSSLFNLLCGLAVFAIGADWIYVLVTRQFKTIISSAHEASNPHEKYLKNPPQIKKEDLDQYVDVWVDITNLALIEATKIVLIENPLRSLKYVGIVYVIWTVASWFSFRTLISLGVLAAFAIPKAYQQHHGLIHQHLDNAHSIAKDYITRGVGIVDQNTGNLATKAGEYMGLVSNPNATKKQA